MQSTLPAAGAQPSSSSSDSCTAVGPTIPGDREQPPLDQDNCVSYMNIVWVTLMLSPRGVKRWATGEQGVLQSFKDVSVQQQGGTSIRVRPHLPL